MRHTARAKPRVPHATRIAALTIIAFTMALPVAYGEEGGLERRDDPPGHRDANHCITPFGVDLNELYGVPEQFRNRVCQDVTAGEHWRVGPFVWIVDDGFESVYPEGYTPVAPNPIDDFATKLVSVRIVVDGKAQVLRPTEALRTDIDISELEPGAWEEPLPMASLIPRARPESVGEHTFQAFFVLSAEHCDGLTADRRWSCLPAGELAFGPPRILKVTAPKQ